MSCCSVSEALADNALERVRSARRIINTKRSALIIAEIELREIALQVLFIAMLVGAFHAALEHAEKAFDGVSSHVVARPFIVAVVHAFMAREGHVLFIPSRLIGHDGGVVADLGLQNFPNLRR